MTNPSPCLRIRTSFTSVGKRISCGSRTAWLAPFRNIDARRATPLDMDLAADLDAADLTFPVRTRFIDCPLIRSDAQLAYALHMATSRTSICPDAAGFRCIATNPHSNWRLIFQQIGQFLSDTPKNAPNPRWLGQVRAVRHWTRKSRASIDFREIFRDFRTSVDVTGRLWSWDGWDSNPGPKP